MTAGFPLDVQMIEDEAMGLGQWLTEHPAELEEHLDGWDSDAVIRKFSEVLGETALGLSLAHLSAGQTKVVMDVMVQAMWLAHVAIRRAKSEQEEGLRWLRGTRSTRPSPTSGRPPWRSLMRPIASPEASTRTASRSTPSSRGWPRTAWRRGPGQGRKSSGGASDDGGRR